MFLGGVQYVTRTAIVRADPTDPALLWNPAAWFLGLYEYIAGSPRDVMPTLALRALIAAAVPMAVTVAIYAFGYKRLLARAVETPSRATRSLVTRLASGIVRRLFVWRPQEQAICSFMLRAIVRNSRHNMMMSIYIGGALALMITFVLPDMLRLGPSAFATPTVSVLALPLLLSVGLAVGGRILITIPADMPARWIFMTSAITARHADAAAHKGLLLLVLPPVIAIAALSAGALWGVRVAALHVIYCTALSLLLCEVLLIRYRSLPMTRPFIPGASRFHILWGLYMIIFTTYTLTSARLERDLLRYGGTRRRPDRRRDLQRARAPRLGAARSSSCGTSSRSRSRRRSPRTRCSRASTCRRFTPPRRSRPTPTAAPRSASKRPEVRMLVHSLRLALRSLRRRPGFSTLAVLTITLGAGASAAVAAVAYGVLLKPLPYPDADRVVAVWPGRFMSQVDLRYLRDRATGLAGISGMPRDGRSH